MIAFLRGRLLELAEDHMIVETAGVGYEVFASKNSIDPLSLAEEVELYIYSHVKEDAFQLFGFLEKTEKQLFLSLIKVNGIGPKMAMQILSGSRLENILEWIDTGDAKALTSLPKVGKKTAEQMILSLKGKLVRLEEMPPSSQNKKQMQSALVNLGFKLADVQKVLVDMEDDKAVEDGVRESLQKLTSI